MRFSLYPQRNTIFIEYGFRILEIPTMSGKHPLVQAVENAQLKTDIPAFAPGDTVIVQVKVKEGERERLQAFEGVVIAKKNRGLNSV